MRAHSTRSTPIPITLIWNSDRASARERHRFRLSLAKGEGRVRVLLSPGQWLLIPSPLSSPLLKGRGESSSSVLSAHSSGILRHRSNHFFHRGLKPNPHRARHDGVTDVEFRQKRNLVDERDIFVVDAVAGVDLEM